MNDDTLTPPSVPGRRAVLAGCARDCAAHLPAVLAHMERIAGLFDEAAFVFVENDSTDATARLLAAFAQRQLNCTVLHLDGLVQRLPLRTERLAHARNRVLETIDGSSLRDFDVLVLMDLDDINRVVPGDAELRRALAWLDERPERAAVFANQPDGYYDLWALRHPERCPGDVWEAVLDHHLAHPDACDQQAFDAAFAARRFALPRTAEPMAVDSAFGGLGLYKMDWALKGTGHYAGTLHKRVHTPRGEVVVQGQVCEHVAFHARLREAGGTLHVLPWLVNLSVPRGFPASAWRTLYRVEPLEPVEALPAQQPAAPSARIAFVVAHFDPHGRVHRSLAELVQAAHAAGHAVVVVSTGLSDEAMQALRPHARVIRRDNEGYDFWSYKVGIEALRAAGLLDGLDRLVLLNSSLFIADPAFLLQAYLQTEASADVLGMTYNFGGAGNVHLQSYWLAFQHRRVIGSAAFQQWWGGLQKLSNRDAVIAEQEIGLSRHFTAAGFTLGTMFARNREQKCLSLLRAMACGFFRYQVPAQGHLELNPDVGDMMDPTMFCWDGLFEALGVVKLRLLRDNPNDQPLAPLLRVIGSRPEWQARLDDALAEPVIA